MLPTQGHKLCLNIASLLNERPHQITGGQQVAPSSRGHPRSTRQLRVLGYRPRQRCLDNQVRNGNPGAEVR